MSEHDLSCGQIGEWLLDPDSPEMPDWLTAHAAGCADCREQAWIHRSLVATFAEEEVPELSPAFDAGLEKKLTATRIDVKPLAGWRAAAMVGYTAIAVAASGWMMHDVPLPTIDLSAPWVPVAAFLAVPLTLSLAVAASRWLPGPAPKALHRALAL